jgi:asparagine synthase (glutamine-hydrolysing)
MCATKQARQLLRSLLLEHSEHDDLALHPDRTSHQVQESVRFHGALVRRMNLMSTRSSTIEFLAPYLDERIVRTALRLDVKDRFSHSYVKPLLALGRPSRMPLDVFQRRDKGEYSAEIFSTFRTAQERIRHLFYDGSVLEDYGLINPGEFQRMASAYSPDGELHDQVLRLERTELWLRSFSPEGHAPWNSLVTSRWQKPPMAMYFLMHAEARTGISTNPDMQ